MENFYDFMSSALPWLCMGLLLAVFFAISAKKKGENAERDSQNNSGEAPAVSEDDKKADDSTERKEMGISIRPYKSGDETEMSALVAYTLKISNRKDYPREYIDEAVREHSPAFFVEKAKESHFYVACDSQKIVGCGGITGYWGSTTESYLLSFFVLPEYQGRGIGRRIIETIEKDEFFKRAWRTEVGSSITAVDFYRKFGYEFKNGVTSPDEYNVIRLEKRKI